MCERAGSVESTHFPIAVQVFLNFTVVKADFLGHICLSVVRRRIKLFRYNDAMLRVIIFHSSFNTAGADTFPRGLCHVHTQKNVVYSPKQSFVKLVSVIP